jgi:Spy/CpxP family protein refolding chaperone
MRWLGKAVLVCGVIALACTATQAQFGIGMRGFGGAAMLLTNKGVQDELKLTKEQTEKLSEMQQKMFGKMQDLFGKLQDVKPEERAEKAQALFKEASAEAEKEIKAILKPEQMKRLKQIEMQQAGVQNFANEEVLKAVKLTDAQKDKIKIIVNDLNKQTQEAFKAAGRDPAKVAEVRKKMESLRKDADDKVSAILNAEQKKAYKEMLGEPFELKFERPNIKP